MIMKDNFDIQFDSLIDKLEARFDRDPYSLSSSEIQMLKWFADNPGYLGKNPTSKVNSSIRVGFATAFIKKSLSDE